MTDINMKAYDDLKAVGILADELFDANDDLFWMLIMVEQYISAHDMDGESKRIMLEKLVTKRSQLLTLKTAVNKWTKNG